MANKKINIGLGFTVDKTSLNTLKTELQGLSNLKVTDLVKIGAEDAVADLQEIQSAAAAVQSALEKSFNAKLNTQDLTKFQKELQISGQSIASIKASFDKAGAAGQNAFRNLTAELLTTNRQLKQSNEWLDKMAETMANTVRWSIASTAINAVTGSIQKAYSFTKELDTSLNDIRIVTGKSADEMARFAKEATVAAKNLGATTTAYTKAALIYEQQGLGAADVEARSNVTTKVANVTGQNAAETSEQLTAIWNGYKVSAAEAELYIDKVSAVAATTAADLQELSEGMGKVASAANSMGVDIDQLNASLATIISVTRQDASSIGTSLKTIFARMGDLAVDGQDEFGVTLGDVTSKMKAMGIEVLDSQGQMREMGTIIEEVAEKWGTWTRAQQQAAAVALAGKRQYNNLIALFENWDMYESAKATSAGGAGELQKQQDIYMESMQAHLNQLRVESEELYQTLMNPEGLNPLIDGLTRIVSLIENMTQGLGGGIGLLRTFGAIGLQAFGGQITRGVTRGITNVQGALKNRNEAQIEASIVKDLDGRNLEDDQLREIVELKKAQLQIEKSLTAEEIKASNDQIEATAKAYEELHILKQKKDILEEVTKRQGLQAKFDAEGSVINEGEVENQLNRRLMEMDPVLGAAAEATRASVAMTGAQDNVSQKNAAYDKWDEKANAENISSEDRAKALENQTRVLFSLKAAEEQLAEVQGHTSDAVKEFLDALEMSSAAEGLSKEQKKEHAKALEAIRKAYDENGNVITDNVKDLKKAANAFQKIEKIYRDQEKEIKDNVKALKGYNGNLKELTKTVDAVREKNAELKKSFNLKNSVQNVTDLATGFVGVVSGVETLIGLGDIWSNENLTGGEKFLQTITAISFGLPQIISGMSGMFQGIQGLVKAYQSFNAAKAAAEALNKGLQAADITKITLTNALALAKSKLTKEEYELLVAQLAQGGATRANAIATLQSLAADNAKTFSLQGVSQAAKGAATSIISATTAFLASPIGWVVLAIAGAVAALTIAVVAGTKAWNADAEAAKSAAETAKALSDEYDKTKAAYEELKQSITDYQDAQTAISEMVVGTQEWRDAIQSANEQVLELIKNYPTLARYMSNENGRLVISEEGLEAAEEQQRLATNRAFQDSIVAEKVASEAALKSQATNLGRKAQYTSVGSVVRGRLMSTLLGPAGFIINGAITGDWNPYNQTTSSEEIQHIANLAGKEENADMWASYEEFSAALEGYSQAQIDALWENSDELQTLCEEMRVNSENTKALNTAIVQSLFSDNQDYQDSEYQEGLNQALDALRQDAIENATVKYDSYSDKAIIEEYKNRKIASGEWDAAQIGKVKGNSIEVGGEKIALDADVIRNVLAEQDASDRVKATDVGAIDSAIEKSVKTMGAFGKTLTGGAQKSSSVADVTAAEYQAAKEALEDGLGDLATDFRALGYDSLEDLKKALKSSIDDYEETAERIKKDLPDPVSSLLYGENNEFAIGGLTLGEQQAFGKQITAVFDRYGSETAQSFLGTIKSLDNSSEIASAMSGVDSYDDLAGFTKYLQESTDLSDDFIAQFVTTLQYSLGLFEEFSIEAAQAQAANLKKVLSAVSEMGDTISPEDYDLLFPELKSFFSITEDGLYALNSSALNLYNTAKDVEKATFEKNAADANEKVRQAQGKIDSIKAAFGEYEKNKSYAVQSSKSVGKEAQAAIENESGWGAKVDVGNGWAQNGAPLITAVPILNQYLSKAELNGVANSYGLTWDEVQSEIMDDNDGYVPENVYNALQAAEKYLESALANNTYIAPELELQGGLYEAHDKLTSDLNDAETELDAALANQKAVYEGYAPSASLGQLQNWLRQGLISSEIYENQLYRFKVKVEYDGDVFEELHKDTEKTKNELEELQEQAELLFGEGLVENLKAQQNKLATWRESLNSEQIFLEDTQLGNINESFLKAASALNLNGEAFIDDDGYISKLQVTNALQARVGAFGFDKDDATYQLLMEEVANNNQLFDRLDDIEDEMSEVTQQLKDNAIALFRARANDLLEMNEMMRAYEDTIAEFTRLNSDNEDYAANARGLQKKFNTSKEDAAASAQLIADLAAIKYNEDKKGYELNGQILTQEELRAEILKEGTNLQELALALKENLVALQDTEIDQMDEIAEQYDTIIGYTEARSELLEHELTLYELMYGENYAATKDFYLMQENGLRAALTTSMEEFRYWQGVVAAKEEAGDISGKDYETARANMLEAGKEVAATSAELGQFLYENFERAWNSHFEGFASAKSEFEWISEQSERTFDAVTGVLKSQQLINTWNEELNKTIDADAQKRIKSFIDLQEEKLANLQEEGKLSQYNLDLAQAEFDLLQARIALEDAQNNKTQMRLMRGADGSYSYQYVADSSAIQAAERDLAESALNAIDINKDAFKTNVDTLGSDVEQFQARYLELAMGGITEMEEEELRKMWEAMRSGSGGVSAILNNLRTSIEDAAQVAGLSEYENLTDAELLSLLPTADSQYFKTLMAFLSGDFDSTFGADMDRATAVFADLANLSLTNNSTGSSLFGDLTELLNALSTEVDLGTSKQALLGIGSAADDAEEGVSGLNKALIDLFGSLQVLASGGSLADFKLPEGITETLKTVLGADWENILGQLPKGITTPSVVENITTYYNNYYMDISLPEVTDSESFVKGLQGFLGNVEQNVTQDRR